MGILETICLERRADAQRGRRERPASSLERRASPPRRAFARCPGAAPALIAECKRASPSRGLMVANYSPRCLAQAYEAGGASVVSVLTEPRHFLGSEADLEAVREAVGLPVLRKDFIVDPWQVKEAWALGADAILLIAAALEPNALCDLASAARELGLSILAEIRDGAELEAVLKALPDAIGINSRDLRDFSVDTGRAASLATQLPAGVFKVAESGLKTPREAAELGRRGFDAFLVGEALATSREPELATRAFVEALG